MSDRFEAQLALDGWSEAAQERLGAANVMVVGAGGRGGIAAAYLAAAGVGKLGVVDGDQVAVGELHRQLLHFTPDQTANKSESVRAKLALINSDVHVDPFPANVDAGNVELILEGADLVIDCANDYAISRLINDACVGASRPFVIGETNGWRGSLFTVLPGDSSCLRCAEPEGFEVPTSMLPAIGPVAGAIGSLQALEGLKILAGAGAPRVGAVSMFNGLDLTWTHAPVARMDDCICAAG